ncbi:MAG: hypothetical protein U0835_19635 [Isosphaeraceae bacterium]
MGGTAWSVDHYRERESYRHRTGTSAFAHTDEIRTGQTQARVHDKMNPMGVTRRESRDSEAHPTSHAVAVLMDVTGSMGQVPVILQANLPKLMGLLVRKDYLEHPQILIGGIGDATCDRAPLQVGQFESGIEIEDDLGRLFIEQGGGPSITESYELALYFMARHTSLDCYEKRGKRGYLFVIGDEIPYSHVKKSEVKRVIGDDLQADLPVEQLLRELEQTYDVYYVLPKLTQNWSNREVHRRWTDLLGQNVLRLEDPAGICELIAGTVGVAEGRMDASEVEGRLVEAGSGNSLSKAVAQSLAAVRAGGRRTVPAPSAKLPDSGEPSGVVKF